MPSAPPPAALGLGDDPSPEATRAAARRLRAHIERRAAASRDPAFVAAREAELRGLDALLERDAATPSGSPRAVRWLVAWAAVASSIALALGLTRAGVHAPAEAAAPPATARIAFDAEPPGSQFQILARADEHVAASGESDAGEFDVPSGAYTMRVSHPDCPEEWKRPLDVSAGDQKLFAPRLCLGAGVLVVRSNVSDDRLQLDGIDVGSTGATFHALRVGRHSVNVSKSGYTTWQGEVKILPDEPLTLHAELEPLASGGTEAPEQHAAASKSAEPASEPAATQAASGTAPPPPVGAASNAPAPSDRPGERASAAPTGGRTREPVPPRTGAGGSKTWHDAVRQRLVSEYDRNQSRSLDTREELESIPCEVWQSIERSYETGGLSVDMTHLYGFDGSEAPANTLGVTHAMRGYAFDRMKQCGLKARR